MLKNNIIINADDFGMSKGVNAAIIDLLSNGSINSTSIMATSKYYNDIDKLIKIRQDTNCLLGIHLDLTFGQSLSDNALLSKNSLFNRSFIVVMLMTIFQKKKMLTAVYKEFDLQIKKLKNDTVNIDHIDGHQHIHAIPLNFKIVQRLAAKYNIPRIRILNESFLQSLDLSNLPDIVSVIKFFILKICTLLSCAKSNVYFYSILHTCSLSDKNIKKIKALKSKYKQLEIMIHPSYSKIDADDVTNKEYVHLSSNNRNIETKIRFKELF